jgi:hypothetical protein
MPTSTTITFAGLFVLRPDLSDTEYELGILRAVDAHVPHFLQIAITPDPSTHQIPIEVIEQHIQNGRIWQLEVEGSKTLGVESRRNRPTNRMKATPVNDRDLGWMVNLENDEFHRHPLERTADALRPIIRMNNGSLFTSCKTDSVDTIQGRGQPRHLGFITGGISLNIDTSAGQKPVLLVKDQQGQTIDLLKLTQTDKQPYNVTVFNIPLKDKKDKTPVPVGSHFRLYYDNYFKGVNDADKFDLKRHENPVISPPRDACDEAHKETPDPFRCGGILLEGGAPLI